MRCSNRRQEEGMVRLGRARVRPPTMATVTTAVMALAAFGATSLEAQSEFFSGYTNLCFDCVAPVASSAFESTTLGGLTYENAQFSTTTADGMGFVGINANLFGEQDVDNFGGFYLDPTTAFNYGGHSLSLLITFVDPGSHSELFMASLTGRVTTTPSGGVGIDFADNDWRYWFDDGFRYGVRVKDVSLSATATPRESGFVAAPITGDLSAVVPEPATMFLMGTGLLGLGVMTRRRRRNFNEVEETL